jgi:hypothetical protein
VELKATGHSAPAVESSTSETPDLTIPLFPQPEA